MMLCLAAVLYANASKFDATELKSLITFVIMAGGVEGLAKGLTNYRRRKEKECEEEEQEQADF